MSLPKTQVIHECLPETIHAAGIGPTVPIRLPGRAFRQPRQDSSVFWFVAAAVVVREDALERDDLDAVDHRRRRRLAGEFLLEEVDVVVACGGGDAGNPLHRERDLMRANEKKHIS